jgi:serine/threonine protein kinase
MSSIIQGGGVGSLANYCDMKQVGEGTYGYVYRARDARDGSVVALKRLLIHKDFTGFPLCAVREIKFLKQLQHPNVVDLLDIVSSKGCEHLEEPKKTGDKAQQAIREAEKTKAEAAAIRESKLAARGDKDSNIEEEREREKQRQYQQGEREKMDNQASSLLLQRCGSLYLVFKYLEHDLGGLVDAKYKFKQPEIKCIMKQLFTVLDFLQEKKILHRDIKCSNVLISNRHQVKLADFGLARSTLSPDGREGKVRLTNNVVTMWYVFCYTIVLPFFSCL